jgi:hypothetical protein
MEIVFTNAEGKCLRWDGMFWSSPDVPDVALRLNQEPLRSGSRHCSILSRAERQAEQHLGSVEMALVDLTGMPVEDIGGDVVFEVVDLADGGDAGQGGSDDGATEAIPADRTLAGAQDYLGGGLCSDGAFDGDAGEDDWEEPERQWRQFRRWCDAQGMIVESSGPAAAGGREHDLIFDPETERWVKYTKPGLAGFTVDWEEGGRPFLRNASPSEYLERLQRQNELFVDGIEFAGMWREGKGGWRIRTTQPDVPGRRATMEEISEGMKALGLVQMGWKGIGYEDSTSWRIGRLGVWDVHPANVIMAENGVVVPVDVIITELPDGFPPCHFHPEA